MKTKLAQMHHAGDIEAHQSASQSGSLSAYDYHQHDRNQRGPDQRSKGQTIAVSRLARRRMASVAVVMLAVLGAIAGRLVNLGIDARSTVHVSMAAPQSQGWYRPNIVDRKGRLLATDVEKPSLFADPSLIIDLDEMIEKLTGLFPDLSEAGLRAKLADRRRRFVWLRRGMTPAQAQDAHDLGLPGLSFRTELRRIYPAGAVAGFVLGAVDVDNAGTSGIEHYIDEHVGVLRAHGSTRRLQAPVVLSLDLGVQHGLQNELSAAMERYQAKGATGIILDVQTGEIVAAASLPEADPNTPARTLRNGLKDALSGGTYELGSVFKAFTVAMALDAGRATLDTTYDVTQPLMVGRKQIKDHGPRRPLTVREIFLYSSNVGAALMALEGGSDEQREMLTRFGLVLPISTEAGPVARPLLPGYWGDGATTTISYGHGIAVSPLQLAVAAAALVNGGYKIAPTFLPALPRDDERPQTQIISRAASTALREVMALNVSGSIGTGRKAAARGYRVGGKTGTAEIPGEGGRYAKKAVISSFLAAFPIDAPRYLTLVSIFEPKGTPATRNSITASANAAPTTARIINRVAPLLGVLPNR